MRARALLTLALLLFAPPAFAQRLPATAVPVHYDITVAPDLAAATFAGEEMIRVRLDKPAASIVLNAAEITFLETTLTAQGKTQTAKVSLDPKNEQATLTVGELLPAGEAAIRIKYSGILNRDLRGFYLSEANNRRFAVTQLEATDARRMFPSFDEPAFKATFALTAIIDRADTAISNGRVVSDEPKPEGKRTITFSTTPKMSTYLVALAVGDFVCNSGSAENIPLRVCSTPDKKALTGFALESTGQILRYFNRYYSIRYPFEKLDIVAVPDFSAGAMENTAAIFYRETLLLADERTSVGTRKEIAVVLAHEIAHQWFGDLVTMQWWDDIWLNEGFANWMMSKPVKDWKPEWHVDLDEVSDNQRAMNLDALESTRPVRSKANTPAEINELFDPIAYEKGAAVLRMLEAWVGEEDFRKGVNAYIERFKYANARAEDFWTTLAKATGKPIDAVMPTFVDQPGVPLVNIDASCGPGSAGNRAVLTQQRDVQDAAASKTAPSQVWRIPVCLRLSSGTTVCEIVDQKSEKVALPECPAWLIGNAAGRGYYRSAEPPAAVKKAAAEVERIAPAERMVLLSDEWALVRAGRHDVGTFLDLGAGFTAERIRSVLEKLTGPLATIADDIANDAMRPPFRSWMAGLLNPSLAAIGMTPAPSDTDDLRTLRALLFGALGITARDSKVQAAARDLVNRELDAPGSVDPTLLNTIVTVAALQGDAALYDRYLERSRQAADPEERYRYMYALASFTDPALVRRTMDLILGPEVRSQDAKLFIGSMFGVSETRRLAWDLVRQRWDDIQKKTGEFVGTSVIVNALGSFCDARTQKEVEAFFEAHPVPDAERALQQTLERIGACARLAAAQQPKLAEWLKRQ